MKKINDTPYEIEAIPFIGPGDKPVLTVIVKATFDIEPEGATKTAEEQRPIAFADEFFGDEGGSVKFESDAVPFKPAADIVLVGKAFPPDQKKVQAIDVQLRVGKLKKKIRVYGDRHWTVTSSLIKESISIPMPFDAMDLVYEKAFGGIDLDNGSYCAENLIGVGYYEKKAKKEVDGMPLPNIENPKDLVNSRKSKPKPVGFGFYGKAWMPRVKYLGTYDEKWKKERKPMPPADFDFKFYNGAHPDLQVKGYLQGGEEVELKHLSPDGNVRFLIPERQFHCIVTKRAGMNAQASDPDKTGEPDQSSSGSPDEDVKLNLDTLCIVPEDKQFYLVWRGYIPIASLEAVDVASYEVSLI